MAASCMNNILDHNQHHHIPVLLEAAVSQVVTNAGTYVDATFGRGSHTQAMLNRLSPTSHLIAFDKDPSAIAYGHDAFHDKRLSLIHASFSELKNQLAALNLVGHVQGILFDLGVSSPQLDDPTRGFSFMHNGPLDMRMDTTQALTAEKWLNTVAESELADALWQYGEEKLSRRIAKAIVLARKEKPITTTKQLADLIRSVSPFVVGKHPATRTFQAIRIVINRELQELAAALSQAYEVLAIGGRLAVISFHSLEDRLVKQFIRQHEQGARLPRKLPVKYAAVVPTLQAIGSAIKPSQQECTLNPRARSAILRIAEKRS